MKKFLLTLILLISLPTFGQHVVTATKYYPGTKGLGKITASGSKINFNKLKSLKIRWVALSHDMFKQYHYKFGDVIRVESSNHTLNGYWVVKDKMHPRCKKRIDFMLHYSENIGFNNPMKVKIYKVEYE